jgi:2-polyprenyl-3-methyl-5-hydroxy-6-metoxy-1,4-benzoquinol methylase
MSSLNQAYYAELAAAHCRGALQLPPTTSDEEAIRKGKEAKLETLYRFKRPSHLLLRVKEVLGVIESFGGAQNRQILDVASQRGALLWPLLDKVLSESGSGEEYDDDCFTNITSIDIDPDAVAFLSSVSKGGQQTFEQKHASFNVQRADVMDLAKLDENGRLRNDEFASFPDDMFDIVICSEILEHLQDPAQAAREIFRVASHLVICTVPAKPDNNPEHIQLFYVDKPHDSMGSHVATQTDLKQLWLDAGGKSVKIRMVPDGTISVLLAIIIKQ